jgi:sporulation protein YlmC with PRC-barrel domain
LRSAKELCGYHIHSKDGVIGHVTDLIMDEKSWVIVRLAVQTGHWFTGENIVLSPRNVE